MHAPSNASAPGVRLRNRSDTYADITEFLFDEAELLDGLRFDAWAALLAPDLSYRVPLRVTRSTADQARSVDRVMMHFDDDHASIMGRIGRSEEHTSELQSLMRISYAVFCLKKNEEHTQTYSATLIDQPHTHLT